MLWGFGRDDVFLVDLPLFHAGGLYSVFGHPWPPTRASRSGRSPPSVATGRPPAIWV